MKKAIALAIALLLALTACSSAPADTTQTGNASAPAQSYTSTQEPATAAPAPAEAAPAAETAQDTTPAEAPATGPVDGADSVTVEPLDSSAQTGGDTSSAAISTEELARLLYSETAGHYDYCTVEADGNRIIIEVAVDGFAESLSNPDILKLDGIREIWEDVKDGFVSMSNSVLELLDIAGYPDGHCSIHILDDRDQTKVVASFLDGECIYGEPDFT